jgi:hypothetical protein
MNTFLAKKKKKKKKQRNARFEEHLRNDRPRKWDGSPRQGMIEEWTVRIPGMADGALCIVQQPPHSGLLRSLFHGVSVLLLGIACTGMETNMLFESCIDGLSMCGFIFDDMVGDGRRCAVPFVRSFTSQ